MKKLKKILITGGSGLIAQAILNVSKNVDDYVLVDVKKPKNKDVLSYKCDVGKKKDLNSLIKKLDKDNINVTKVINAIHPTSNFKKYNYFLPKNLNTFNKYIYRHLSPFFVITNFFYDYFSKKKIRQGKIVHLSSIYGKKIPNFNIYKNTNIKSPIEYSICKASIDIMSKYFSDFSKYNKKKIFVSTISPAGILSPKISNKFIKNYKKIYKASMLNPNKVAKTILKTITKRNLKNNPNIIISGGINI